MKRMILITLVFVVILCGMVSKAHAQQFTISIDTIAVVLPPEEGVICRYHDIIPLSNVVKHHGYYFLKLDVRCEDRNKPSRYGDDITWWDGSILVAVSEDGSSARRIELPSEFDKALSSSYDMFVRDDIVWIKSVEKYDYRYWPMDIHPGYSLDETTWTWHYEKEVSDVAYDIAQVDGNKLIPVVDFEQPMCRDRIVRPTSFINQLSMSPNRCLLKFVSSNQKDCGVLDIEDTTVKIHYFYLANNDGYGLVE